MTQFFFIGSALHLALTEKVDNQLEIVSTLLRRGANPNAITVMDDRPVLKPPIGEYLQSCEHPRLDVIRLMLRYFRKILILFLNIELRRQTPFKLILLTQSIVKQAILCLVALPFESSM